MKNLLIASIILITSVVANSQNNWAFYNSSNTPLTYDDCEGVSASGDEIWISGYGECIRIKNGEWHYFNYENSLLPDSKFYSDVFFDVNADERVIGIKQTNDFYIYDGSNWQMESIPPFPPYASNIESIVKTNDGNYWVTNGYDPTIARYNGSEYTYWIPSDTCPLVEYNKIEKLLLDQDGQTIWFSMINNGIVNFDGETWNHYDSLNSALRYNEINDIVFDNEFNVWVATDKGIGKYDRTNWTFYSAENGAPNYPQLLAFDSQNTAWVYYDSCKLGTFDELSTTFMDSSEFLLNSAYYTMGMSIDENDNKYITNFDGFCIYNENGVANVSKMIPSNMQCRVSPNPAKNHINIELQGIDVTSYTFGLHDITGKKVLGKKLNSNHIEINKIPNGVYIYTIDVGRGKFSGKLVINR